MNTTGSTHFDVIINEMCRRVGTSIYKINPKKEGWYLERSWTPNVEQEFAEWMVNYIHKIPQAQQEIYQRRYMKKYECKQAVKMFLLQYGWKTCHEQI